MEFELGEDSRFIVLASDGIWEFLDNYRIMNIVNPYYNKYDGEGACNAIVKEATMYWEKVSFC